MAEDDHSPNSRRAGHGEAGPTHIAWFRRAETQVVALSIVLAAATYGIYQLIPDRDAEYVDGPWWIVVLAAVLFGVAEYTVFNVHFRRQGISFTLSEIPMAIAIAFLTPGLSMVARFPVALFVLLVLRRNQPYKLGFNLALIMFEMALAILFVRGLVSVGSDSLSGLLVVTAVGLMLVMPLGSMIISLAIARFEGRWWDRVRGELTATWWLYPIIDVLAAMVVASMLVEPWLGLVTLLPVGGIWWVLHSYGQLNQEMRDLDLAHGFAGRVGRSLELDEIGETAVAEMADAFRAQGAALIRFDADPAVRHRYGHLGVALPESFDDPAWSSLLSGGPHYVSSGDAATLGITMNVRVPAMLVAPVADEAGVLAVAVVCQSQTYGHAFGRGDVARLRNMAQQLGVSLRRGILHHRLEYEARHDALTDLPGRRLFEWSVEQAIAERASGGPAGVSVVVMIDLDRFKEVNDTLGHHAGDTLLIEFSRRVGALLGPDDQLARLAGDEFAVLARRATDAEIDVLAGELVQGAARPVTLDGIEIVVTASVGVAEITDLDTSAVEPMRRADIAMYNAKWQRSGVEMYRDEIDRRSPGRLSMLGDLRAAIETNELTVLYQPKVDLVAGVVIGAEALVRWEHEKRGLIAPTEFVRVAEDTGLIKDLTDLVLARAIADLRRFEGERLGLAVNLSTRDLFDSDLPDRVRSYLDRHGVDPASLTLEITESSLLVDAPRTRATIDELHGVGLRLAIDDFGTGYSSLSYLRRLPVQELKIDRSFVVGMEHDPQDEVIVRSTVDLGHNLGLTVVAEGVENRRVLARLRAIGCDVAQGFEISSPMTADELIAWVRSIDGRPDRFLPTRAAG